MSESVIPLETIESVESTPVKACSCCAVKSFCSVLHSDNTSEKHVSSQFSSDFDYGNFLQVEWSIKALDKRSFYIYDVTFTF